MDRYVCIHGHFYQPPRDSPWLEAIERQDSAYPHHDWNERVLAECYAPNASARILDEQGRIAAIANNYERVSFDAGPTLLSWMQERAPEVYAAILEADRRGRERFSGHGPAIAQAYNHMILPLASRRDQRTQVLWGIADFRHRFGRDPEGMWLPETAADSETLEALAEAGMRFTVLAPRQARRVRRMGGRWSRDLSDGSIDTGRSYLVRLPSRRSLAVFFYDDATSRAIAFEHLLADGGALARRLIDAAGAGSGPRLSHVATDGETYGHHRRFGDMALAFALQAIDERPDARLTVYGEHLDRCPPAHEVELVEPGSWSCVHGVERWRADCGCRGGRLPGGNQAWRAPLRAALDWLRDELAPRFEACAGALLRDPWAARDDYVRVVLDRSRESVESFLAAHAARELSEDERVAALKLLEMQRHAMLMYTSCGWFFDDLADLETVQVLAYAARAAQLARECAGADLEDGLIERLAAARSNRPEEGSGADVYRRHVEPLRLDLARVGAHYGVTLAFEEDGARDRVYCYRTAREDLRVLKAGKARLLVGRVRVHSDVTWEQAALTFGVLHLGGHDVHAGVRPYRGEDWYRGLCEELSAAFSRADFTVVLRLIDLHLTAASYSLKSLFRDEQRRIVESLLAGTLKDAEQVYRRLYEEHAPLGRVLADMGVPYPRELHAAAEFVINADLRRALGAGRIDAAHARALIDEARAGQVALDTAGLAFALQRALEQRLRSLADAPEDLGRLGEAAQAAALAAELGLPVDLSEAQKLLWHLLSGCWPGVRERAAGGDAHAAACAGHLRALGDALRVRVEGYSGV